MLSHNPDRTPNLLPRSSADDDLVVPVYYGTGTKIRGDPRAVLDAEDHLTLCAQEPTLKAPVNFDGLCSQRWVGCASCGPRVRCCVGHERYT